MNRMSLFLVGALLIVCLCGVENAEINDWKSWKQRFGKSYEDDATDNLRKSIWEQNLDKINQHNLRYDLGYETYRLGVNAFADQDEMEFAVFSRDSKAGSKDHFAMKTGKKQYRHQKHEAIPDSVDWRTKGYVTPVENQGECGSSLYYGIVGAMEGQWFKRTKNLIPLSVAQLEDCCGTPAGCSGMSCSLNDTYTYIETKGLESLADYPTSEGKCMYDPKKSVATCSGYIVVVPKEDALKAAVASVGPIAAVINASPSSFQLYTSGVYNDPTCTPDQLDHAVLIVGYGTDPTGGDYWIVKNSWGVNWGMQGYILMARNRDNQCGIASYTSYPYYTC